MAPSSHFTAAAAQSVENKVDELAFLNARERAAVLGTDGGINAFLASGGSAASAAAAARTPRHVAVVAWQEKIFSPREVLELALRPNKVRALLMSLSLFVLLYSVYERTRPARALLRSIQLFGLDA